MSTSYIFLAGALFLFVIAIVILFMGKGKKDDKKVDLLVDATQSWVKTPVEIRKLGGALFGDRRYDHVFIYHNSAPSYYGVRGFRGQLRV